MKKRGADQSPRAFVLEGYPQGDSDRSATKCERAWPLSKKLMLLKASGLNSAILFDTER